MDAEENNRKHIQNTSAFALLLCLISFVLKIVSAIMGKTVLQYVDVSRSFLETAVVAVWWYVCTVQKNTLSDRQRFLFNRTVRTVMVCSAVLMAAFAVVKYAAGAEKPGSLTPGFLVSLIGAVDNFIVCRRYFNKAAGDKTVLRQGILFAVKAMADAGVALTLMLSMFCPGQTFTTYFRLIMSFAVAAAMAVGGILRD